MPITMFVDEVTLLSAASLLGHHLGDDYCVSYKLWVDIKTRPTQINISILNVDNPLRKT